MTVTARCLSLGVSFSCFWQSGIRAIFALDTGTPKRPNALGSILFQPPHPSRNEANVRKRNGYGPCNYDSRCGLR